MVDVIQKLPDGTYVEHTGATKTLPDQVGGTHTFFHIAETLTATVVALLTANLADGEEWVADVDYSSAANVERFTARMDVTFDENASGVVLETGGSGEGLCVSAQTNNGTTVVSFRAGSGLSAFGNTVIGMDWTLPVAGRYTIEVTASRELSQGGRMYVDGTLVDTSTGYTQFTNQINGGDVGGIGKKHGNSIRAMPGIVANGDPVLQNITIHQVVVWPNVFVA